MSERLSLQIDVLSKTNQRALVVPTLTPAELIAAILEEFRQDEDLDYLSNRVADYQLIRLADKQPLTPDNKLAGQVEASPHLALMEREVPPPTGARALTSALYLREEGSGHVYKLSWTPAIIGRPGQDNQCLAVNLESHPAGLSVSRRHAQITEENGRYSIESLSANPTAILRSTPQPSSHHLELGKKTPLAHGDILWLERSDIKLKFIVRT